MALLNVENLQVSYGMINAIKGVSFEVNQGEIVALIGANGAGKTTIMHAIGGLIGAKGGSINFDGHELTKTASHKIVSLGLTQVPEGRRIFQQLTVRDNLVLGAYSRKGKAEMDETMEMVYEKFPILKERQTQIAGTLSGGEQQMLAVGRALMSHPKMLLLDEPSMGLSPLYVNIIFDTIKQINAQGTTVFLVEQNAKKALSIADRAYVLEIGKITKTGKGVDLLNDESIKKAYLGE
ncbi:MAG: ABC transporter ATP-binding protein [Clostridia bacterium]|nr:ABC transporter ATP-binding protein [Clostridia bacterium]